jgi:putative tricarboxylic transport membrane protein
VGPRAFPLLLAALMAVAGAWLVIKPSLTGGAFAGLPWKALGYTMGAVLAYAALFELLGFTIATVVMAVPVGMAFGGTWKQSLVGGLGLGLALFLLFDRVLDVVLPTGWLAMILGGR